MKHEEGLMGDSLNGVQGRHFVVEAREELPLVARCEGTIGREQVG